jgi:pimeloyl-ACP methyl ester carboxylesterase
MHTMLVTSQGHTLAPPVVVKRPRRWPRRLLVLGALLIAGMLLGYFYGPRWLAPAVVWADNQGRAVSPETDFAAQVAAGMIDHALRIPVGPPADELSVWILDPSPRRDHASQPRGTVVLLHGIHDRKQSVLGLGRSLATRGFRAVLVDQRGQGLSTGQYLTFGDRESRDLAQVLDDLETRRLLARPLGVYGPSFGGGTALLLAARDERVDAVVAVAAFESMRAIVPQYIRRYTVVGRLLPSVWMQEVVDRAGRLADFNPDDASPVRELPRTAARTLLIYGDDDPKIGPQHGRNLHAAAPARTELLILPGEDHETIMRAPATETATLAWFDRWLGGAGR